MERIEVRAISTICLSLTLEIKHNVLNEKSPCDSLEKLEKIYM